MVLDDDPTGTQSATGVRVLLAWDAAVLERTLREVDAVYVQTNSRALTEAAAVALVTSIRDDVLAAAGRLGVRVRFVLRGDSTLRGHVFAETDVFTGPDDVVLFVPAFPAGGRTTIDGVHLVGGVPAAESEYAADPVFGFTSSRLEDYVREKSSRTPFRGPLEQAPAGAVVVPDVRDDDDVRALAADLERAERDGRGVVVRCAAPLAAELAGVASTGYLDRLPTARRVLVVCGSHTEGARVQLEALAGDGGGTRLVLPTAAALADPLAAGRELAARATGDLVVLATERVRAADHGTLDHGERVMAALVEAVRLLRPRVDAVVSKGGITAAEVARTGLGAREAVVEGQVAPGVSVWRLPVDGREVRQVVVPGNVGGPSAIVDAVRALR
ncbi:uncharacterized protein YgbK (DUF1537 family) [Kineococcus rhizosphaerae]|uniref:Uncharacterized protein YgbK (DUF1537 family) n=1 Tax=Kineococcus rhizosphaerae TaxID=559628 RepID=A0A2T0R583_9ACTN|nr:uncharacterized protein YgbK (DUF1537 family) [Kineococcus rhizosphaerae]